MQFLKTAFWVILAVAIALFAKANWYTPPVQDGRIPIKLWDDWLLYIRLPTLLVAAFLLGLLPMWLFARVKYWRIRRQVESAERAVVPAPPPPSFSPDPGNAVLPSGETAHDAAENAGFRP